MGAVCNLSSLLQVQTSGADLLSVPVSRMKVRLKTNPTSSHSDHSDHSGAFFNPRLFASEFYDGKAENQGGLLSNQFGKKWAFCPPNNSRALNPAGSLTTLAQHR